ncbi:putative paraoxonase [Hypoxylon crocopeplum]|nr:putative paraoxonase [Hypoxylon crocopeplum]
MVGISIRTNFLVVLLAPLTAFLVGRLRVLSLTYFNALGRMPSHANFTSYEVKFTDRIRNCEDVLLVEARSLALLACDLGRDSWNTVMGHFVDSAEPDPNAELYAYKYTDQSLPDTQSLVRIKVVGFDSELRTLGLEFHEPSSTLFLTNHPRQGPRIEQFHLDLDTLTATHLRSLSHPLIRVPNAIAAVSESEFFVTNQHHFTAREHPRLLWAPETYIAPPIASVVHVRILENGTLDAAVVARQAYPNGIALFSDTTLAVASSNKRLVYLYSISSGAGVTQTHPSLKLASSIWLPFMPDNLAVSKNDGALLIAGHPHLPSLNKFASSRRVCYRPEVLAESEPEAQQMCATTGAASWASEWTPEGGVEHIYAGWEYPTSATVVRDREKGVGIVMGLYAKGLLVWRDLPGGLSGPGPGSKSGEPGTVFRTSATAQTPLPLSYWLRSVECGDAVA